MLYSIRNAPVNQPRFVFRVLSLNVLLESIGFNYIAFWSQKLPYLGNGVNGGATFISLYFNCQGKESFSV